MMIRMFYRCTLWPLIGMIAIVSMAAAAETTPSFKLATFSVDVTPPLGHPLLANIDAPPVQTVDDPLFAKGFVLSGPDKPVVVVAVDWLEIRNDAYDRWRDAIAEAVGSEPRRVLVHSVHQHDAPLADLEAQRILDRHGVAEGIIDLEFHERTVQRVAKAAKQSLQTARPVTHYGVGQARVERIAANRRYIDASGKPRHNRSSSMPPSYAKNQEEGLIDPWLKTLSFWNGDAPLAAINAYSVHPQSIYRTGRASADFPGLARAMRQAEMPDVPQIYVSGASGNTVAGKYNDSSERDRRGLVERLHRAMVAAWDATERHPMEQLTFRTAPVELTLRNSPGFTAEDLQQRLQLAKSSRESSLAAMGLSCRKHFESGREILIAAIDLGDAVFASLPGESYVEYQLLAQSMRPESSVVAAGYGECGSGYIPPESAWDEGDDNLGLWCWISPGAEQPMTDALRSVLEE